jgi:hypothetical protein
MPNLPVSPNWRWPEGDLCRGHLNGIQCVLGPIHAGPCAVIMPSETSPDCKFEARLVDPAEDIAQLRKDRDELAAALEHAYSGECYLESSKCEPCKAARALLDRTRPGWRDRAAAE